MAIALMIIGVVVVIGAVLMIINPEKFSSAGITSGQAKGVLVFGLVLALVGYGVKQDSVESPGLKAVLATIPSGQAHRWETGQLNNGIAVVVNDTAGYWVKDGTVYAVNGIAKNWSSSIEYAPAEITWSKVEAAAK